MDFPTNEEFDTFVYKRDFVLGDSKELLEELNAGSDDEIEDDISTYSKYKTQPVNASKSMQSKLGKEPITYPLNHIKKEYKIDKEQPSPLHDIKKDYKLAEKLSPPYDIKKEYKPEQVYTPSNIKKDYSLEEQEVKFRTFKSARRDDDDEIDIRDRYSPKTESKEQSWSIYAVRKRHFKTNSPGTIRQGTSLVRSPMTSNSLTTATEFHSSPSSTGSEIYHLPNRENSNENLERNVSGLNIATESVKKEIPTPVRQSPPLRYASPIKTPETIPNSSLIKNETFQGSPYRSQIPPYKNNSPRNSNNNTSPHVNRIQSPVHRSEPLLRSDVTHQQNPVKKNDEFIPPAPVKLNHQKRADHQDTFNIPNNSFIPNIPRPGENVIVNKNEYSILRLVGEGASGKVFQVYSKTHNDIFALKWVLIKKEEDRQGILNEIKLLMSLKAESSIVKLYDHLNTSKVMYMIMEYGEVSFQQIIANQASKDWSISFIKFYWHQMLKAVNAIHENNIVHSDLKPANFVVVKGFLKLIDFGIAKTVSDDTTNIQRDVPVGTVNYMAPEALTDINEGRDDARLTKQGRPSDIWSLGCILYQMVYGKPPFYHSSMHQRVMNIMNENYLIKFESATVHNGVTVNVPPTLIELLQSCLNRKVTLRPTMLELLNHPFVL